jgi:hypothetical protein
LRVKSGLLLRIDSNSLLPLAGLRVVGAWVWGGRVVGAAVVAGAAVVVVRR